LPKEKADIKINAKAIMLIALVLSAFCFNLVCASSTTKAESSVNSMQTSVTLQYIGSINYQIYLGAFLDLVSGGYNTWVTETGKGLAIYASEAALAPLEPVLNNGTYGDTLNYRLQTALPLIQEGLYGAACITWMTSFSDSNTDTGSSGTCFQCTEEVANGTWNSVIQANAIWIKNNFPYPLILRIDQEFNVPGGFGWAGNSTVYVAAYQQIVNIFREENVSNVEWCWCPNFVNSPGVCFTDYYPGDNYVDWIGTDLYANTWGYANFDAMLNVTDSSNPVSPYDFALAHNKPFMIAEWGLNITGDMSDVQSAVWMQGMFDAIATRPNIQMVIAWAVTGMSVLDFPQALQVYISNITSSRYSAQYP
jgi:hypothetical protein